MTCHREGRTPRGRRAVRVAGYATLALASAVALVAAAAYWQANAFVSELQAGDKREVVEAVRAELDVPPRRPAIPREPGPAKTILLIGSDIRLDDPGSRRADTLMLARVDPARKRIALLSIPRDLLVDIPGRRRDRINVAYDQGGVALLTETVRETLGVEINHFVEVEFSGFRNLVARLGGVYVPVDGRYFNRNRGTPGTNYAEIDLLPGYQRLNGEDALAFVRYRHRDSDLHRAARQQLFLREASRQLLADYDVLRLRSLIQAFVEATTSDIDDLGTLWRLYRAVEETPADELARLTIPVHDLERGGAQYLAAGRGEIRKTVERWYGAAAEEPPGARPSGPPAASAPRALLRADGGLGRELAAGLGEIAACAPTALPSGFRWGGSEPARAYRLAGRPAAALWATRGSGSSILWTMTTWQDPPTLSDPTETLERDGSTYELWLEDGRPRQVAWRVGDVRAWITNTLQSELSTETMLELAASCK
jgi:polyisoprenyl-teichoic acid--peptidoglycan teichoic acid transferase